MKVSSLQEYDQKASSTLLDISSIISEIDQESSEMLTRFFTLCREVVASKSNIQPRELVSRVFPLKDKELVQHGCMRWAVENMGAAYVLSGPSQLHHVEEMVQKLSDA